MSKQTTALEPRAERELLIVFTDLTRFSAESRKLSDAELAEWVDELYEREARAVEAAGGRVLKFIGDGALIVFAPDKADAAAEALLNLKAEVDAWMTKEGRESRLTVKIHSGNCIAGPFGGATDKRFDVIGQEVNAAALLPSAGFSLSAAAFRKLSPAARKRFKKHTPPVVYIPLEGRRPTS
jgi:class 3 adenylate cyclase